MAPTGPKVGTIADATAREVAGAVTYGQGAGSILHMRVIAGDKHSISGAECVSYGRKI